MGILCCLGSLGFFVRVSFVVAVARIIGALINLVRCVRARDLQSWGMSKIVAFT